MRFLGATRAEVAENLFRGISLAAALIMGAGVLAWLSIFYVMQGSQLILMGALVGIGGWLAAMILPAVGRYEEIQCPRCLTRHQVRKRAGLFYCEVCGARLFGRDFWRRRAGRTSPGLGQGSEIVSLEIARGSDRERRVQ